jgi:hypothetical protein
MPFEHIFFHFFFLKKKPELNPIFLLAFLSILNKNFCSLHFYAFQFLYHLSLSASFYPLFSLSLSPPYHGSTFTAMTLVAWPWLLLKLYGHGGCCGSISMAMKVQPS